MDNIKEEYFHFTKKAFFDYMFSEKHKKHKHLQFK